jgi:hypothetical protein
LHGIETIRKMNEQIGTITEGTSKSKETTAGEANNKSDSQDAKQSSGI